MRGHGGVDPVCELADLWRIKQISQLSWVINDKHREDTFDTLGCCTQIKVHDKKGAFMSHTCLK